MPTMRAPPDRQVSLHFPLAGIDLTGAFCKQPNRPISSYTPPSTGLPVGSEPAPVAEVNYVRTAPVGLNVRSFEPLTNRARGAQRPGLTRYINAQPAGSNLIQMLAVIVTTDPAAVAP